MTLLNFVGMHDQSSCLLAETLSGLVTGDLICVGGHQAWPLPPTDHAVRSITLCQSLATMLGGSDMLAFFDDIGAATACAGAVCAAPDGRTQPLELPGLDDWCGQHLNAVASALSHHRPIPQTAIEALNHLCATADERANLCAHIMRLPPSSSPWIAAVELLVYAAARDHFVPLQLIAATGIESLSALLERSMSNGASRTLHKMMRGGGKTRLRLDRNDGVTGYWADLPPSIGGPLLLRRETEGLAGTMTASNFCGALLAQLYFRLCRPSRVLPTSSARTVAYVIPCYDRGRVRQGMHAFFEIFSDLRRWFGLERVTLISIWETGCTRVPFALDSLSAGVDDLRPRDQPAFVTMRRY